ncbi:MAG: hypothetical protein ACXAHE_04600 [Roseburia sp. 1XD42-69]
MTHGLAKQFWKVYIGMAGKNGMHANMSNPVDDFKASAHAGEFDKLTDDQYYRKEADAEELSSFWHYKPSESELPTKANINNRLSVPNTKHVLRILEENWRIKNKQSFL